MIQRQRLGLEPNYQGIRLFLDTANTQQWENWLSTGLFYGVTTNPLLLERDNIPCEILQLKTLAHISLHWGYLLCSLIILFPWCFLV